MSGTDRLLPARLKSLLATREFGRRIYYYPETVSTNTAAVMLARAGEPHGTVVVTDFQSRGRGRLDHEWTSRAGEDLLFTLILRPDGVPGLKEMLPVTLVFSSAVAATLKTALATEVTVKWPNDIMAPGGKIGGILAEGTSKPSGEGFVAVGTGVNVNSIATSFPLELRERVASCRSVSGRQWDRAALLADFLESMESHYRRFRRDGFEALRPEYESRLNLLGRVINFQRDGRRVTATVEGVGADGALRARCGAEDPPISLYNEEVRLDR